MALSQPFFGNDSHVVEHESAGIFFATEIFFGDLNRGSTSGLTKGGGHGVANGDQRSPIVLGAITELFRQ